jgi:hypothetical protein
MLSWPGSMISGSQAARRRPTTLQLHLGLAESPAPAGALWELLDEERRRTAMVLLSTMIAQSVTGEPQEETDDE